MLSHPGIGTGEAGCSHTSCRAGRRQRNTTAGRQRFHQHAPALPDVLLPADYPFHWDEYVGTGIGAVHKRLIERKMATANLNSRCIRWNKGAGNAQIFFVTQQMVGVVSFKRQADNCGDWSERNVALFPVDSQAKRFLTFVHLFAHNAVVRQ